MGLWEDRLKIYDEAVAHAGKFERKGKTVPYTSANGHMFSILNKEGELGIRLSKESGKTFIEKHQTPPFMSHGANMRGYVTVSEAMLEDIEALAALLEEGHDYAWSLPPK